MTDRKELTREELDAIDLNALCPEWRKALLAAHEVIVKVSNFIATPVTYLFDQFNGTAEWKAREADMDKVQPII